MTDLKWGAPPASPNGRGCDRWGPVAESLRERPNEWALISGESGIRSPGNVPRAKAFRGAPFEFTYRSRPDGAADIYARFVPEVSA